MKVDDLAEARKFCSGVVGLEDAFTTRDDEVAGPLFCFRVNNRQFVEVSPTLKGEEETVKDRGYQPLQPPNIGRDGRWLLQLYDKNFTRTEMMVRKPVQTPCCSPNLDDFPGSSK